MKLAQVCMAGIVFAKFTTPTSRAETIMFSKNALISMRNGSLYLLVRMADLRSQLSYREQVLVILIFPVLILS